MASGTGPGAQYLPAQYSHQSRSARWRPRGRPRRSGFTTMAIPGRPIPILNMRIPAIGLLRPTVIRFTAAGSGARIAAGRTVIGAARIGAVATGIRPVRLTPGAGARFGEAGAVVAQAGPGMPMAIGSCNTPASLE